MQTPESERAVEERHCFLVFLAAIGLIALAVPVVTWAVEGAFALFK